MTGTEKTGDSTVGGSGTSGRAFAGEGHIDGAREPTPRGVPPKLDPFVDRVESVSLYFSRFPVRLMLACLGMTAIIGACNYLVGVTSLAPLYLLPITMASWVMGIRAGLVIATVAALLNIFNEWLVFSRLMGIPNWLSIWNGMTRMLVYLLFAYVLTAFHGRLVRERRISRTDPQTGVANSRALHERIDFEVKSAIAAASSLTVAFFDVDNFKEVNDQHGHETADQLVACIAGEVTRDLAAGGLFARFGGDEFVLVMRHPPSLDVRGYIGELVGKMRQASAGFGIPRTFSVGVFTAAGRPLGGVEMIQRADNLMYRAKGAGKDRIVIETMG